MFTSKVKRSIILGHKEKVLADIYLSPGIRNLLHLLARPKTDTVRTSNWRKNELKKEQSKFKWINQGAVIVHYVGFGLPKLYFDSVDDPTLKIYF